MRFLTTVVLVLGACSADALVKTSSELSDPTGVEPARAFICKQYPSECGRPVSRYNFLFGYTDQSKIPKKVHPQLWLTFGRSVEGCPTDENGETDPECTSRNPDQQHVLGFDGKGVGYRYINGNADPNTEWREHWYYRCDFDPQSFVDLEKESGIWDYGDEAKEHYESMTDAELEAEDKARVFPARVVRRCVRFSKAEVMEVGRELMSKVAIAMGDNGYSFEEDMASDFESPILADLLSGIEAFDGSVSELVGANPQLLSKESIVREWETYSWYRNWRELYPQRPVADLNWFSIDAQDVLTHHSRHEVTTSERRIGWFVAPRKGGRGLVTSYSVGVIGVNVEVLNDIGLNTFPYLTGFHYYAFVNGPLNQQIAVIPLTDGDQMIGKGYKDYSLDGRLNSHDDFMVWKPKQ